MVLHGGEPGPPVALGRVLGLGELPGEHAARADIAGLARRDHLVQRRHRLLDRGVIVPPVDLVQVHVVGTEPPQRGVDRGEHVLAAQPSVVGARAHREEDLGGQHVVLTAAEDPAERAAGDLLAHAA